MSDEVEQKLTKRVSAQTVMVGIQCAMLLGSIVSGSMNLGRRDAAIDAQSERIKELATITADLARTVSTLSATDREYAAKIDAIQARIDRLERKN